MKLVYAPEGAEAQSWDFKPQKLMSPEAEAIERVTGMTFQEFGAQFLKGSTLARHAMLWVMLKRKTPSLKFEEVQFAMDEVDVVFSDEEMVAYRDALEAKARTSVLDEKEQVALDALREAMPDYVPEAERQTEGEVPETPLDSGSESPED